MNEKNKFKASIIIPTYNRFNDLSKCLDSIKQQKADPFTYEVIIIDNFGSASIVQMVYDKFINTGINFKVFQDIEPGLLTGRHRGFLESNGELLCFIDDDVELTPMWMENIINFMTKNINISLLTGPSLPKYENYPPDWVNYFWNEHGSKMKYCGWLSLLDFGDEYSEIDLNYVWGLNFTIRKEAFINCGGFNPDCITKNLQHFQGDGETGLSIKAKILGLKGGYLPGAMVYHLIGENRLSVQYFKERAYYQGVSDSYTELRNKNSNDFYTKKKKTSESIYHPTIHRLINLKKFISIKINFSKKINQFKTPHDVNLIKKITSESYNLGYQFHQNEYLKNENVIDWVHKENYLNYKLPTNH